MNLRILQDAHHQSPACRRDFPFVLLPRAVPLPHPHPALPAPSPHRGKVRKEWRKIWKPCRSRGYLRCGHWSGEACGASIITGGGLKHLGSVLADAYFEGRPQFLAEWLSLKALLLSPSPLSPLPISPSLLPAGLNSFKVPLLSFVLQHLQFHLSATVQICFYINCSWSQHRKATCDLHG